MYKRQGFTVTQQRDLGKAAMERAILSFGREAQGAEVALVFFAGHGIQSEGRNFLVPVDAQLADDLALPIETVDVDLLLRATQGATTRLIILDACRNNPLAAQMRMTQAGRSIGRGLAPVNTVGGGTLIAFSTAPGTIALDGTGRYSPFAESFAKAVKQPGIEIRQVLTQVRREVLAKTGERQMPWDNSSLLSEVYLAGITSRRIEAEPVNTTAASQGQLTDLDPNLSEDDRAEFRRAEAVAHSFAQDREYVASRVEWHQGIRDVSFRVLRSADRFQFDDFRFSLDLQRLPAQCRNGYASVSKLTVGLRLVGAKVGGYVVVHEDFATLNVREDNAYVAPRDARLQLPSDWYPQMKRIALWIWVIPEGSSRGGCGGSYWTLDLLEDAEAKAP